LNADKDHFFSIISHDLHGPLNTLLDNTHLLLQGTSPLSQAELKQTYASGLTVYSLVETLITWSSLQRVHLKGPLAEINLQPLAHQAVELWHQMADRKNVELFNQIDHDFYLQADEVMLAAIIRNLLANALKYSRSGDRVILSARPANHSAGQPGQAVADWLAISVTDTGVGISPDGQARLFRVDVPYTTPGTAQETGAGLGLMMCKEMVEYHSGRIWVESRLGQGTTVTFTAPLAAEFARYV
jgi:signal transduction histidine kinase